MPGFSYRAPEPRSKNNLLSIVRRGSSSFRPGGRKKKSKQDETAASPATMRMDEEEGVLGEEDNIALVEPSHGWGRGIISDFRNTIAKHWCSEMINFNTKTVGVSIFLFIAVIAPTITFGAVYAKMTNNYIGASELLLGTAWCGIFYALVSGQPMMINGATGPVLTFQAVLFKMSEKMDVPFLSFNAWVGLWVSFYMVLAAFVDLNKFIKYATRFTDEIFAFLIVSIYILDAIGNPTSKVGLMHYFRPSHPHNEKMEDTGEYNDTDDYMTVALLSLLLGLGTTFFAIALRNIRYSSFCCNSYIRSVVTDFAITISVVLFTVIKYTVFSDVPTEELNVPDTFAPTFNCCTADCTTYYPSDCPELEAPYGRRSWIVNIFDLNGKTMSTIFMAAGPAALAFILTFLDNGITWHIVNHPSNKITHGDAYNYDTVISAIMIGVNSILGLPWLVASTVPCIMHISAMAVTDSKGRTVAVQESRLTGLFTHALVLATCFALNAIKLLPLPVLYGVFLFMGLVALPAQQFWQRILLFFQQPSLVVEQASTPYTKYVKPLRRVHLFTLIQLFFFGLLYVVKNWKKISIVFPLFILLCIPVRIYLLPKIFNDNELTLLDGSPEEIEEWILLNDDDHETGVGKDGGAGKKDVDDESDETDELIKPKDPDDKSDGEIEAGGGVTVMVDEEEGNDKFVDDDVQASKHRSRRMKQLSVKSVGSVASSVQSFFERKRERQLSTQSRQSINEFMENNGLVIPPDKISGIPGETNNKGNNVDDDDMSDVSDNIDNN